MSIQTTLTEKRLRRLAGICLLAVSILTCSFFVPGQVRCDTLRNFANNDPLPSFSLPSIAGGSQAIQFTPNSGKPAVLLFFSIRPEFRKQRSLALLSELAVLAEQYRGKANFIGIFSDDQDRDTVKQYIKGNASQYPVAIDSSREVYNLYGVFMMPLVVLVSQEGRLHEVIPYTYNIKELVGGNLKLLLGEWTIIQLQESMQPKEMPFHSKEEQEYIRRVNYGRVMYNRKMYSQAIREFTTATKLMPDKILAYAEMGFAYLAQKDWQEAETIFRNVLKKDHESDDGVAGLGLALYGKGDIDHALPELENAFIDPDARLEVILALAEIHEKKGDIDKANRLNKLAITKLMTLYKQKWE